MKYVYRIRLDGTGEIVPFEDGDRVGNNFSSWSTADTKEELIENCSILDEPCKCCGSPISARYGNSEDLIRKQLCFHCDLWDEEVGGGGIIIEGSHFSVGSGPFKGFSGRQFKIETFDGRTIETDNLWHQGSVPPHWIDKFPDNARFV